MQGAKVQGAKARSRLIQRLWPSFTESTQKSTQARSERDTFDWCRRKRAIGAGKGEEKEKEKEASFPRVCCFGDPSVVTIHVYVYNNYFYR